MSCRKGDLICLIKDGEFSAEDGWVKGQNERTAQNGAISTDSITILPTLSRPADEILVSDRSQFGFLQRLNSHRLSVFLMRFFVLSSSDSAEPKPEEVGAGGSGSKG